MKKCISWLLICVMFIMMIPVVGCKKNNNDDETGIWYDSVVCSIHDDESQYVNVKSVNYYEDNYYVTTEMFVDDGGDSLSVTYKLFKISSDGELIKETIIDTPYLSYNHLSVFNGMLLDAGEDSQLRCYDVDSGELLRCDDLGEDVRTYGTALCESGFVILSSGKLIKYDSNCEYEKEIDIPDVSFYSYKTPFYVYDEKYYVVADGSYGDVYYEIDPDTGECEKKLNSEEVSNITMEFDGDIVFDASGAYMIDLDSMEFVKIAEWNMMDIRPPFKAVGTEENINAGSGKFCKIYSYQDGDFDLVVFRHAPEGDRASRIPLKIGGYGVDQSLSLRWAVYCFNTSQDAYRAYTEDYIDSFAWATGVEAQAATAELIQYFNEGNAPDIYYGFDFDYRYLYNAGMVIDMMPYIEADMDFDKNMIGENIQDLVFVDGICYQLFAGYYMNGFWGLREFFGEDRDLSVDELETLSEQTGITATSGNSSANVADYIIRYSMNRYVEQSEGDHVLSIYDLENIVDFSLNHGGSYLSSGGTFPNETDVADKQYLLTMRFVTDILSFARMENANETSYSFVGFPGIGGSARVINPECLLAISSGSDHPDACWELIKCIFSPDLQRICCANGVVPINQDVLDVYLEYASNPDLIPEYDILYGFFNGQEPTPDWIIDDFRQVLSDVNTVITYDWGIYNLICEEINSYDLQGKTPTEIAESLQSRLDLYVAENY